MVRSSDMQKSSEMEMEAAALVEGAEMPEMDDADESPSSVYEIGYHLLPTLSEEQVAAAVKDITELLKKNGAESVGDRFPEKIPLAYTIQKRIAAKIIRFDEAYFGWVAFEMPREALAKVEEVLVAHPAVLRYIALRTSREEVAAALSGAMPEVIVTGEIAKPKREAEAGGEVSEVALDEALQTIQAEDAKTE